MMAQLIEVNGKTIEFPDNMSVADMETELKRNSISLPGAGESTRTSRFAQGLRDPLDGGAQLLTNILPKSMVEAVNSANNWVAEKTGLVAPIPEGGLNQVQAERNQAYEADRAAAGETGFDGYRALGNVLNPVNFVPGAALPRAVSLTGRAAAGATVGAVNGAIAPVNSGDFATEKAKQIGLGAIGGAFVPSVLGAASRVISPNASRNTNLSLLKSEGVKTTIGQTLGGRWNAAEEKLTSVPILGDMISNARTRSLEQFNNAAINRASGAVGNKVEGFGQAAVKEAGAGLSKAYNEALDQIKVLKFDRQFAVDLTQLKSMAQGLTPPMRAKFNAKLQEVVGGRTSGTGSMLGPTFKKVDSEIGGLAAKFGKSSVASESELGDAFTQLQSLLKAQALRSNPNAAKALEAADEGWANLVRVEGAAKAAQNAEGLFTPGQFNAAIKGADSSTRGRAVARGDALLQDMGNAGQSVLGNKVPNSFTTDRAIIGAGALGSYFLNPLVPAGLLTAGAMYTRPMQTLLSGAVTARPKFAQPVAEALRKAPAGFGLLGGQVGAGLLNYQGNQ